MPFSVKKIDELDLCQYPQVSFDDVDQSGLSITLSRLNGNPLMLIYCLIEQGVIGPKAGVDPITVYKEFVKNLHNKVDQHNQLYTLRKKI